MNIPAITEAMRREASQQPNGYVYCIDPDYAVDGSQGAIPPQGIIGAYPVDAQGAIIETFMPNPNYKPIDPSHHS